MGKRSFSIPSRTTDYTLTVDNHTPDKIAIGIRRTNVVGSSVLVYLDAEQVAEVIRFLYSVWDEM